ncbi:MAG: T9SS type A sorting domain-containing protein [Candidatus Marinimicrobia bacterium]|nr:T9SS type A sorting domain-containing protein [Candidatus Neomarinimicrobiota bacterium]
MKKLVMCFGLMLGIAGNLPAANWTEIANLSISGSSTETYFGYAVCVSGDYAIVGAFGDDSTKGAAYIFIRDGSSWTQQAKITASDGAASDGFGYSVSISGNYAIVGAVGDESSKGAAYIFIRNGSSWTQQAKLTVSGGADYDQFGSSVSISGDYAIVGSGCIDSNKGAAYIYYTNDTSLPVELTDFTVQSQNAEVLLTWRTESETENLGFILQRRQETGEWNQVASYVTDEALQGHGSTTEAHEYSYTDAAVQPGATYTYRLGDVDYSGTVTWHKEVEIEVKAEEGQTPTVFSLQPSYPNPFNAQFTIPLTLKESMPVAITLYDIAGRVVKLIQDRPMAAGDYHLPVNADGLHSGIYFVRITVGNSTRVEKIVLMK